MNHGIDYFPLVSLKIFCILFLGRTVLLYAQGINPFVIGKGKSRIKRVREILLVPGFLIWILEVFLHAVHSDFHLLPSFFNAPLIKSVILRYISYPLIVLGLLFFLWTLISFQGSWRMGIDKDHPGSLITTGAFAVSRNPIFVFMDAYNLALFLYYQNLLFLVFAFAVIIGTHLQILAEEQFLFQNYGQPYLDYMKQVKRYLYF
jgi:protein-S-isoprenylcysteine O-methyltransferase Ste14